MTKTDNVMTVKDVAEYLKLHTNTVYRMVRRGDLPGFRIGGDWRFNKESIDHWRLQQEEEFQDRSEEREPQETASVQPVTLDLHGNRRLRMDFTPDGVQIMREERY